jgi:hypothetical protein
MSDAASSITLYLKLHVNNLSSCYWRHNAYKVGEGVLPRLAENSSEIAMSELKSL